MVLNREARRGIWCHCLAGSVTENVRKNLRTMHSYRHGSELLVTSSGSMAEMYPVSRGFVG
jgi:hypothetical protein